MSLTGVVFAHVAFITPRWKYNSGSKNVRWNPLEPSMLQIKYESRIYLRPGAGEPNMHAQLILSKVAACASPT